MKEVNENQESPFPLDGVSSLHRIRSPVSIELGLQSPLNTGIILEYFSICIPEYKRKQLSIDGTDFAKSRNMQTAIAKKFRSSSDLRLDSAHVGAPCTILETSAWVRGKTQVALVEFADGVRRVWPVNALIVL